MRLAILQKYRLDRCSEQSTDLVLVARWIRDYRDYRVEQAKIEVLVIQAQAFDIKWGICIIAILPPLEHLIHFFTNLCQLLCQILAKRDCGVRIKQSYLAVHKAKVLREILSLVDVDWDLGLIDGLLDLSCLRRHRLCQSRHLVLLLNLDGVRGVWGMGSRWRFLDWY